MAGYGRTEERITPTRIELPNTTGPTCRLYNDVSPVSHVDSQSPPTFIACSEFENPLIDVYCFELAYRLGAAKGHAPPFVLAERPQSHVDH